MIDGTVSHDNGHLLQDIVRYSINNSVPINADSVRTWQGWAQGSFVEAEAEVEAESSRPRRGRLNSRQGRGEATPEKPSFP